MAALAKRFSLVAVFFLTAVLLYAGSGKDDQKRASCSLQRGPLSAAEVKALEAKLKKDPGDENTRGELLQYYTSESFKSEEAKKKRKELISWIMKNKPESDLAADGFGGLDLHFDNKFYEKNKEIWLKLIGKNPENIAILRNAAYYVLFEDMALAEDLIRKCKILDPDNPNWPKELGMMYWMEGIKPDNDKETSKNAARKALPEYEEAYSLSHDCGFKYCMLADLAKCSFDAGNFEKAKKYALQMLEEARKDTKNWNYGNAIHDGNLVLGRISFAEGKIREAKEYLLKAGDTPGSPQLDSFGPNMTLAKDLLEKGEKDAVIDYLKKCSKFWKEAEGLLKSIDKGESPEWGVNLYH